MTNYTREFPSTKAMAYVYRGCNPTTGEFYIGYRMKNVKKNISSSSDLGVKYLTSSKKVKHRFNEFTWIIIAEFFDAKDAYNFEQLLIFESWKQPGALNKHCTNGKHKFNTVGVPSSDVTKLKISIALSGKPKSDEAKLNMSIASKGKPKGPPSDETRLKIAIANKGQKRAEEAKLKMSIASKGKPKSEEHKLKLAIANLGVRQSAVACPHCLKTGGCNAMKRYHFDNCKEIKSSKRLVSFPK